MEYTEISRRRLRRARRCGRLACGPRGNRGRLRVRVVPRGRRAERRHRRCGRSLQHHPDVDLRYPNIVRVVLTTHATGGVTALDVALAREVSSLAAAAGAPQCPAPQALEIAIDTMDAERIRPFWAAVLGYRDDGGTSWIRCASGHRSGSSRWTSPRTDRDRFHIDVSVAHDAAPARLAAALAAGGRLVTDQFARSWWVLADADGNEACICTWQDR